MKLSQVALQLFTIREHAKSPEDFAAALTRVAAIGYRAVQLASRPAISDEQLAGLLADNGLTCCSSHEGGGKILEEPETIIESLRKLNCNSIAYPYPGGLKFEDLTDVLALAKRLNNAGRIYQEAGITLAYHNHAIEFRRFGKRLMLDVIYEETDPRYLQGEPDTYWVQYGGGDPVAWCRKLKGRLPLLHLKDYKVKPDENPTYCEIGQGNLDWKAILTAAEESGCQWYIVEQDRCDGDSLDSAQMSFEYLRDHLCA